MSNFTEWIPINPPPSSQPYLGGVRKGHTSHVRWYSGVSFWNKNGGHVRDVIVTPCLFDLTERQICGGALFATFRHRGYLSATPWLPSDVTSAYRRRVRSDVRAKRRGFSFLLPFLPLFQPWVREPLGSREFHLRITRSSFCDAMHVINPSRPSAASQKTRGIILRSSREVPHRFRELYIPG